MRMFELKVNKKQKLVIHCQASRRILDEELTARLAFQTRAFASHHSSLSSDTESTSNSTYERIFPLCADYQEPSRLIRRLPEFAQLNKDLGEIDKQQTFDGQNVANSFLKTYIQYITSGPGSSSRAVATSASESAPHYAEADIISLQESSDGSTHSINGVDINLFTGADSSMPEFPRQKLTFKEKLGEGQFGEVHSVWFFAAINFVILRLDTMFLHPGLPDLFS